MDHLTSVSDIPLPGEDINNRNEMNHETNIGTQHNPEFNKTVEHLAYTETLPAYDAAVAVAPNINFDENVIIIDQQVEVPDSISQNIISVEKVISQEDANLINSIQQEIETQQKNIVQENMVDTAAQMLQETIMEVDQSQSFEQSLQPVEPDIKTVQIEKTEEREREQTLAETVEDLQKFVEQTTQEAANDIMIGTNEIVDEEETTEIITELPEVTTDTAKIVTETSKITEIAEVTKEVTENPTAITVNLDDIMDVPVHDNSVEIKDVDINNSIELENVSGSDTLNAVISEQLSDQNNKSPDLVNEESIKEVEIIETATLPIETNPGKRTIRRNSTIEAIKNEWTETDNMTIEEIKEEMPESTSSASEPVPMDVEAETEEPTPVEAEDNTETTEVIVLQSINDGIHLNLDENVTIEIIDESKSKDNEHVVIVENTDESVITSDEVVVPDKNTSNTSEEPDKQQPQKEEIPVNKPPTKEKEITKPVKEERHTPIPCHLLGRNVDNPTEDLISNGRTPPKPRLGVKVPYRFLTSQIVSKQEITDELLEIHAKRNPERDPPVGGDIFFAKKLTQRLANKISQNEKSKKERSEQTNSSNVTSGIPDDALLTPPSSQSSDKSSTNQTKSNATPTAQGTSTAASKSINDNSDLLAILEGDVDVDLTKEITNSKLKSNENTDTDNQIEKALEHIASTPPVAINIRRRRKMDPEMEREIALKQLESLPKENKKNVRKYGRRGRPFKYYEETVERKPDKPREIVRKEPPPSTEISKAIKIGESSASPTKPAVVKPQAKSALEIVQTRQKEPSENVKQAAENIVDKIKKKKLKDISSKKTDGKPEEMSDDLLDASLTPKKVSKTYSRKDNVVNVNVPADLEQMVNDQSALESEECAQRTEKEDSPDSTSDEKKTPKSSPNQQKKSKRSIAEEINTPEVTLVSKRARIIKPKIIWDPAESVPRKLKPQIVVDPGKPKRGRPRKSLENVEKPDESPKAEIEEVAAAKNDTTDENIEAVEEEEEEEVEEEEAVEETSEKASSSKSGKKDEKPQQILKKKGKILSRAALNKVQTKKILLKRQIRSLTGKLIRSTNGELKSSLALSKKKKQLVQKIANQVKTANRPKTGPKKTELDKLLMDEGAVNMLYAVRHDDRVGKRNSKLIPSKDLLNRTIALRKVISQSCINENTPTKALRKKESPIISPIKITPKERKKSRDSIRSSIQSPPPSPSYASNRAEASRIIRRHSSSFSSDCSSPRRLSIDAQNIQENAEKQDVKTAEQKESAKDTKKESTDFTSLVRNLRRKGVPIYERKSDEKTYKGKKKLLPETDTSKEADSTKEMDKESGGRLTPMTEKTDKSEKHEKLSVAEKRKLNSEMSKNFSKSPLPKKRTRNTKVEEDEEPAKEEDKPVKASTSSSKLSRTAENDVEEKPKRTRHISLNSNYEEISLRKIDNLVQIILTPSNTKLKNSVNIQMFKELNDALSNLSKDDTCRVVLLTSTDSSFCHGVDFSALIQSNIEKRASVAQEMAANLKSFLRSLAHFPKPIIAGVQGSAVGLGVTMLPLFDLVFASDKATFSTPYGRLGQVPEGIAFLTLPNLLGNTLTSELMFANRKLTASEAVHHGLATRTLWPDKFQEEVLSSALTISTQSGQSMQATKSLLRQSLLSKLDEALESENKLLISHWTSAECQQNFKKLLQEEEWW